VATQSAPAPPSRLPNRATGALSTCARALVSTPTKVTRYARRHGKTLHRSPPCARCKENGPLSESRGNT
jgi:hypothetical protein